MAWLVSCWENEGVIKVKVKLRDNWYLRRGPYVIFR